MSIIISGRNVNDLYQQALHLIARDGEQESSRNGDVLTLPYPVLSVTDRPMERVLFDQVRDCNPFFHLFECLWMLSGQSDARWLDRFVSTFSSRFAEDNGHIWGAYGRRWRSWFGDDQLRLVVDRLKADPKDRRIVISMWDGNCDPQEPDESPLKDVPCNTHIYLRLVEGKLDLTVCVRSNDIIWGAYGANAVHMTFLQEYLAGMLGVPVGKFYQLSNNWHTYLDVYSKKMHSDYNNAYVSTDSVKPMPFMTDAESWDLELTEFMMDPEFYVAQKNDWFNTVARPMWLAHTAFKEKRMKAVVENIEKIEAPDWRLACSLWVHKRISK